MKAINKSLIFIAILFTGSLAMASSPFHSESKVCGVDQSGLSNEDKSLMAQRFLGFITSGVIDKLDCTIQSGRTAKERELAADRLNRIYRAARAMDSILTFHAKGHITEAELSYEILSELRDAAEKHLSAGELENLISCCQLFPAVLSRNHLAHFEFGRSGQKMMPVSYSRQERTK